MTASIILAAMRAVGAEVFLSTSGSVKVRNVDSVPAVLRDRARVSREAIADFLRAEGEDREALLRLDPREQVRLLGAAHPGGLLGRFGSEAAGDILGWCQLWEDATTDADAAKAHTTFNDIVTWYLNGGTP